MRKLLEVKETTYILEAHRRKWVVTGGNLTPNSVATYDRGLFSVLFSCLEEEPACQQLTQHVCVVGLAGGSPEWLLGFAGRVAIVQAKLVTIGSSLG